MPVRFTISSEVPVSGYVPIAAVIDEECTPENTISVNHEYDQIPGNLDSTVYAGDASDIPAVDQEPREWQLVLTDKFRYLHDDTRDTLLLPHQYQPRYDHYAHTSNPSGEIHICMEDGSVLDSAEYELEMVETPEDEAVYSSFFYDYYYDSLSERYDRSLTWRPLMQVSGVYRFRVILPEYLSYQPNTYFVRYNKVFKKNSNYSHIVYDEDVVENHLEVINPVPVYDYTDDYTFSSSSISLAGGSLIGDLSSCKVKRADTNRIRVEIPTAGRREGWYPRVWRGAFKDSDGNDYYLPETEDSGWGQAVDWAAVGDTAISDVGIISQEEASVSDTGLIVVRDRPLYITTNGYPSYQPYQIYDGYNYPAADVDTDSNLSNGINIYVDGRIMGNTGIKDWDSWNGRIWLDRKLTSSDTVKVTYLYEQRYYTMQVPDLNPQVHHLTPSQFSSMPLSDSCVIGIKTGVGVVWWWNSLNPSGVYDGTYNGFSSLLSDPLPTTPTVSITSTTLKLAEVSVLERHPGSYVSYFDGRRRGGGVHEDQYFTLDRRIKRDRTDLQFESMYYSDIGLYDGVGLKKDAVLVIEIPSERMTSLKNSIISEVRNVTDQEALVMAVRVVKDEVRKNVAAGTLFILVDENKDLWPTTSI